MSHLLRAIVYMTAYTSMSTLYSDAVTCNLIYEYDESRKSRNLSLSALLSLAGRSEISIFHAPIGAPLTLSRVLMASAWFGTRTVAWKWPWVGANSFMWRTCIERKVVSYRPNWRHLRECKKYYSVWEDEKPNVRKNKLGCKWTLSQASWDTLHIKRQHIMI